LVFAVQTVCARQLRAHIHHHDAARALFQRVAGVTRNDASEAGPGHKLYQLSEQRLAKIHEESPKKSIWGSYSQKRRRNSNRH
jgi:hypothetical protein